MPLERIGLEACSLTAWLHEGLRQAGLPAICIEARRANAAMKTMPNKTDRNDARALAQIMRTGWYREVHVKSRQCRFWRSLLVARRMVLNDAAPPASSAIIARLLRSALAGDVAAQPLAARFRPYLGKLVEAFKAACPGRKLEPRQFAAREDMDVGLDRLRVVEGA